MRNTDRLRTTTHDGNIDPCRLILCFYLSTCPHRACIWKWQCRAGGCGVQSCIEKAKIYIFGKSNTHAEKKRWKSCKFIKNYFHHTVFRAEAECVVLTANARLGLGVFEVEFPHIKIDKYVWQCDMLVNDHRVQNAPAARQNKRNRWHFSNICSNRVCDCAIFTMHE